MNILSVSTLVSESLHENRLITLLCIPVYSLHMPIYGSNLSQYGKIRERIQAFFALCLASFLLARERGDVIVDCHFSLTFSI